MKNLHALPFVLSAFILASCSAAPTELTGPPNTILETPESQIANDPNFSAKCIQRIKAGLSEPNTAVIDLTGGGNELVAKVTTTNTGDGQKAYQTYHCKRDQDRAITAKLVAE